MKKSFSKLDRNTSTDNESAVIEDAVTEGALIGVTVVDIGGQRVKCEIRLEAPIDLTENIVK